MVFHVEVDDEGAQIAVDLFIDLVSDYVEDVETGKNGVGEVDVVVEGDLGVVATLERICRCDDRASSPESSHNACLGDRYGLLFHCLVDRCPIMLVHLVKFVNQANTFVSQHQCSSFQLPLISRVISLDTRSQTHSRCSLSSCVDRPEEDLLDAFEELRLSDSWISEQQDVDVPSYAMGSLDHSFHASEHGHRECPFDVVVPVDRRRNGPVNELIQILRLCKLGYFLLQSRIDFHVIIVQHLGDTVGLDESVEQREALSDIQRKLVSIDVNPRYLDVISRPRHIDIVPEQHNLLASGNTARQHLRRRFLDGNPLVIAVNGLLLVNRKRPIGLARATLPQFHVIDVIDEKGSLGESTLDALIKYFFELTEHLASDRHYAFYCVRKGVLRMSLPRWTWRRSRM